MPDASSVEAAAEAAEQSAAPALDVFISYSRRDSRFVVAVKEALEKLGRNIWIDSDDIPPAAPWRRELGTAIEAAHTFVFIISPNSLASKECALELERAVELGKRLVPVLLCTVDVVPEALAALQFIDARAGDAFEPVVQQIEAAIETDHDWVRAHTHWLARSLQWETQAGDRSHLLRGSALEAAERWLAQQSEGKKPPPTRLQMDYIAASRKAEKRRLRAVVAASLVAVTVSTALAVLALAQRGQAISQRDQAQSRELAASAVAQLPADPELSVLLATQAARKAPTTQATSALRLALGQSHILATIRQSGVGSAQLSDDGRFLLTAGSDRKARVWDWRRRHVLAVLGNHRNPCPESVLDGPPCTNVGPVLSVDFGPKHLLATGGDDGTVEIWNWRTRRRLRTLPALSENAITSVQFSPDGARLVTATEYSVHVWKRASPDAEPELTLGDSIDAYMHAAFSADGTLVVGANLDGTTRIWRLSDGRQMGSVRSSGLGSYAQFGPDGRYLVTAGSSGKAVVWDWARSKRLAILEQPGAGIETVDFSPDGRLLVTASGDGIARIWNWSAKAELVELRGHRGAVNTATFSSDGRRVVTAGIDDTARIWARLTRRSTLEVGAKKSTGPLDSAVVHPDGRHILTAGSAGPTAAVWDARGTLVARLAERGTADAVGDLIPVLGATFSRDGKLVLAASRHRRGGVLVWNWRSHQPPKLLMVPGALPVRGRALSPDARFVFASNIDGTAVIWDWQAARIVRRLPKHVSPPMAAAFSPDGSLLASVHENGDMQLWDWRSRRLVLKRRAVGAGSVGFARDSTRVLTSGIVLRVWDWKTGRALADLRGAGTSRAASFDPSGELVVSAGLDGTARVWDWRAEQVVLEIPAPPKLSGLNRIVEDVQFGSGGRTVVTAGYDGRARSYVCEVCGPLTELVQRARSYVSRRLSGEERARYLPGS